jgi:hypothetical protein
MSQEFEEWLDEVNKERNSTKMRMEDWQDLIPFDFGEEFRAGTTAKRCSPKSSELLAS